VIVFGQFRISIRFFEIFNKGYLTLHVAVSGQNEEFDEAAFLVGPFVEGAVYRFQFADVSEVRGGVIVPVFELTEGSVVIVKAGAASGPDTDMVCGNVFGPVILPAHFFLGKTDTVHVTAVIHAPDGLGAKLTDIEVEIREIEVFAPSADEVLEVPGIVGSVFSDEHVILALVPHETFHAILDVFLVQGLQGIFHQLEGNGVEFESAWVVGVPVPRKVGAAGGAFDYRHRGLDCPGYFLTEAQLGAHNVVHRLEICPPVGFHHVFTADGV